MIFHRKNERFFIRQLSIHKSIFLLLILITFLSGCWNKKSSKEAFVYVNKIPNEGLILKNWYLLGPFLSNGKGDYLNYDNLKIFNLAESTINFEQLKGIKAHGDTITQQSKLLYGLLKNNTHLVDFNEAFGINPQPSVSGNVYAACEIYSDKDKKFRLDFTSDDGAKIWFNHKQILSIDKSSSVHDYENYIELNIKKGYNFLLIKVYNGGYSWQMIAKFLNDSPEGMEHYKRTFNNILTNNYLNNSIIDTFSTVELVKTIAGQKRFVSIYNSKAEICFKDSGKNFINVSSFKEGLYTLYLDLNNTTLRQYFYKGDIIKKIDSFILKLSLMPLTNNVKDNIETYIYRYKHLVSPQNVPHSSSESQLWQTKIISIYSNLSSILDKIEKKEDPLKNVPGFHIGTFISNIDKHVQYYLLNVPMNYSKSISYPVMVFMPFIEASHRPYLECVKMANQTVTDNFQRLADKYNICVVRPLGREVAKHNLNSIFETDFFEVLNTVKENYNIDTTRLYLTGSCSGGYKALELATRYPGMFAAIGLISPVFKKNYTNDSLLIMNEPYSFIKNINNIPVYILHSSVDIHTPVISSDEFVKKAKSYNMNNIQYYRTDKILDMYYWEQHSDSVVSFVLKHKLNQQPKEISFSTNQLKYNTAYWFKITDKPNSVANVEIKTNSDNIINVISQHVNSFELDLEKMPHNKNLPLTIYENNKLIFNGKTQAKVLKFGKVDSHNVLSKTPTVEGPLADALIHSFIIVKGTLGKTIEKQKINDLADSINAIWKARYFNNLRVKKDTEITESDIENSNLILLGNNNINLLIKKIVGSLPVTFEEKGITVRKKNYAGNKLGCYLTYPNPLNNKRYVVIIGANDISCISLGPDDMNNTEDQFDISAYGFYDFRIWDNKTNEVIERGDFSPQWN